MDLGGGGSLWQKIKDVAMTDVGVLVKGGIDEDAVARLERALLQADFGVEATTDLVDELERAAKRGDVGTGEELHALLARRIKEILAGADGSAGGGLAGAEEGPAVVLMLGVNGTGKTTTAAKLAHRFGEEAGGAVLAASDTFRAGAQDQLRHWAERVGARFVGGEEGGDPAAVAYDAVEAARSGGNGLVLVDTAGRLHTRSDLMEELRKVDRVVGRLVDGAPHERLLVVDATSGQNVIRQAREFGRAVELTGLVLTKFDSTARGGTVVAVARELGLPTRFLGTGEGVEDLEPFDPDRYVEKVLGRA
jgi:fused signal recognition particle receptor